MFNIQLIRTNRLDQNDSRKFNHRIVIEIINFGNWMSSSITNKYWDLADCFYSMISIHQIFFIFPISHPNTYIDRYVDIIISHTHEIHCLSTQTLNHVQLIQNKMNSFFDDKLCRNIFILIETSGAAFRWFVHHVICTLFFSFFFFKIKFEMIEIVSFSTQN